MPTDPRSLGGAWTRFQRHEVVDPSPDLAPFVDHLWTVAWDYAEPYRQIVVPLTQVHVTVRSPGGAHVSGVQSRFVVRELAGRGRVVGAALRPGASRSFLDGPVAHLLDRTLPAPVGRLHGAPVTDDVAGLEDWLRSARPVVDPVGTWAGEVVAAVATDPTLTRVDELAAHAGVGVRRLQRVFAEHVGIGPKWVIRRYRLREVTERIAAGERVDWAALAAELGYADQAHLSRDFASVFGEPPTAHAARYPSGSP